ncbi:ATP-grasp domain-containing protein [Micromonospora sp. ALFpr18c]|uniref:ATP-grasp domain-containing protein n=1 Tax=Micromonospora sp. ALFpr18c TaxID=1458665 RepID=UPI00124B8993|nr:ATP-grasp domain-containing protein [Micromonospora sp. ALFpr18c]KAB1935300.1 ATP-grasp domain-containing protein [Micromonospora sp. ALFpr18c]
MTERTDFVLVESGRGGFGLEPLRIARELGFRTVFVTNDLSRYADPAGATEAFESCADELVIADTTSAAAVIEALSKHHEAGRLAGVMTIIDYYVTIVADVAAAFGLPGLSPEAARNARDKLRTRRACEAAGVPAPRSVHALTEAEALDAATAVGYPCVVKPMTEAASIGVQLCRTPQEVRAHFAVLTAVATDFRGLAKPAGVLVEEYLIGYELSVESVTVDGQRHVIGVTDKGLDRHPWFAEIGETFPSSLPQEVQDECVRVALAALDAIGHDFGATHVELKMTAGGPKLIEINARLGGAQIGRVIRESTGLDLPREVLRMHCGGRPALTPSRQAGAASRYLTASAVGVLDVILGADLAQRVPGVVELDIYARPGMPVRPARSNADVLGHLVVSAPTSAEAARWADAAVGQLSVLCRDAPDAGA